ncbi:unnamed protein product, partial [Mycena citricolor]
FFVDIRDEVYRSEQFNRGADQTPVCRTKRTFHEKPRENTNDYMAIEPSFGGEKRAELGCSEELMPPIYMSFPHQSAAGSKWRQETANRGLTAREKADAWSIVGSSARTGNTLQAVGADQQ